VFGIERIGFLTFTFADNVIDLREAQRRFHSLCTHVIAKRCQRAICVWERQKSGRIHFHLVVVVAQDIRTGADFEAFKRRDYRSANPALRAEWAFWRNTAPKFRFGRTEILPVKSNGQALARYVAKYISKHIGQRVEADKGARLVRFIGYKPGDRAAKCVFSRANDWNWLWRHKLADLCRARGIRDMDQLRKICGPRWAWLLKEAIRLHVLPNDTVYPSKACAIRASDLKTELFNIEWQVMREMESRPDAKGVKLGDRIFDKDGDPVWAVPEWCANFPVMTPPSVEAIKAAEERAREMRLYALRLPLLVPPVQTDRDD